MPSFTIDAPNGKSYTIEGENAQGALAALQKHIGAAGKPQPSATDAITDIPGEIGNAASEALTNIKGIANRGGQGPIEGLMTTGKAALGVPQLLMSPLTGAARSVGGHLLAAGERFVGENIVNPIAEKLGGQAQHPDPQKMYEAAKGDTDLAMTALAARRVGALTPTPRSAPKIEAPSPSVEELKASATKAYESPEVKSLEVKPTVIRNFGEAAESALTNDSFDPVVAEKTFKLLRNLQKVPESSVITGGNINTLRKSFGKLATDAVGTSDGAAAAKVISYLDEALTKVPASEVVAGDVNAAASKLEAARGDYAAAKQAENIDNKLISAQLRADSTNSELNVANTIRQNLRNVVDPTKPKEGRGLLPDELDAAKTIVEGTGAQNAMRTAGNYLGKLQGTAIGGVVGSIFGPAGAAVGAAIPSTAGFLLKSLANRMTVKQAQQLSEKIRSRAPLASSAEKFEEAAAALAEKRDPKAIAGAVLAARNLSANLRSAGLNFSPADILSGLQAPSGGNAQEQEQIPRPPGQ